MTATVTILDTPSLGDRSYLLVSGDVAMVIDPQRDIERVINAAEAANAQITHVVETHVHNDYVTGGLALARAVGAVYLLPDGEHASFDHEPAVDAQAIRSGSLQLVPMHTPGHTPSHVSYLALDDETVMGVFTGGSMLYGAVGRTDLCGPELTHILSLQQHASVRGIADRVDGAVPVLPTHGFGSHCSSGTAEIHGDGTVDDERRRNPALLEPDAERFAAALMAGFGPYPRYYDRMGPANLGGPLAVDTSPTLRDGASVADHLGRGSMVVDLRPRTSYMASHIPGTVNVEARNDLPTYLGWVHDGVAPVVLLASDTVMLAEAGLMLARIGLDDLSGAVLRPDGGIEGCPDPVSGRRVGWDEVNDGGRPEQAVLLDVRDAHEWDSGHHSEAVHVPFQDVLSWQADLDEDRPVWIYCATGNRATVATSLLERAGRSAVLIDDFCLPGDVPG